MTALRGSLHEKPVTAETPPSSGPTPVPAEITSAVTARRLLGLLTSDDRKKYPITTGVIDYFPDALTLVANVSYRGNEKHNPGEALHWARRKSADHADCMGRHLIERDGMDSEVLHAAELAWRSLANLQLLAEKKYNLTPPRGVKD